MDLAHVEGKPINMYGSLTRRTSRTKSPLTIVDSAHNTILKRAGEQQTFNGYGKIDEDGNQRSEAKPPP
jgi:hypothetical protein